MNTKAAKPAASVSGADIAKYVAAVVLLAAGVFGFYWLSTWAAPLRGLLVAAGLVAGLLVFAQTAMGRAGLEFFGEARFELRKVVWPKREESIRATGVIILVIVIISAVLAVIDFVLGSVVGKLLG